MTLVPLTNGKTNPGYYDDMRNAETNESVFYASYYGQWSWGPPGSAKPGAKFRVRDSSTDPIPGNGGYTGGTGTGSTISNGSVHISTINFGSAVRASYGLNGGANGNGLDVINGLSDRIFGMDYLKTIIDPTQDDWTLLELHL